EKRSDTDPVLLASVLFDMATAHSTLGQFRRAATVYRQSLGYQDSRLGRERYIETLIGLARSSLACDDLQGTLEAYPEVSQFDSLAGEQRRMLVAEQAGVFARTGQTQTAIDTYQTALNIEGASTIERAGLHREIGALHTRLDDHEQARA